MSPKKDEKKGVKVDPMVGCATFCLGLLEAESLTGKKTRDQLILFSRKIVTATSAIDAEDARSHLFALVQMLPGYNQTMLTTSKLVLPQALRNALKIRVRTSDDFQQFKEQIASVRDCLVAVSISDRNMLLRLKQPKSVQDGPKAPAHPLLRPGMSATETPAPLAN